MRLRLGLKEVDLAHRFGVHPSTVARTFITWINLMDFKFRELPLWLSRRKINKLMPECFKKHYPSTRVIIDCTEFFIDTQSSLSRQSATWSSYKSHNTVKCLIGIAPHGHTTFVSPVYEGFVSDRSLTEESGLLELLEKGDSVMADKGFDIQDLLAPLGVKLNIPPMRQGNRQMAPHDIVKTKKNSSCENRCFSILLSGCETGQRFRCYAVAMPSTAERKHRTVMCASPTVVLTRFSVWSSIFGLRSSIFDFFFSDSDAEKTKVLCHDRCSVSPHWTNRRDKCKTKQKKSPFYSQTVLFPANGNSYIYLSSGKIAEKQGWMLIKATLLAELTKKEKRERREETKEKKIKKKFPNVLVRY